MSSPAYVVASELLMGPLDTQSSLRRERELLEFGAKESNMGTTAFTELVMGQDAPAPQQAPLEPEEPGFIREAQTKVVGFLGP